MKTIYPDAGLIRLLRCIPRDPAGVALHIFANDITPTADSLLADFVLMDALFPPQMLFDTDFTVEQIIAHVAAILTDAREFENLSGVAQDYYGYVLTDVAGTELLQATRVDRAPRTVPYNEKISIIAVLGGYSGVQ